MSRSNKRRRITNTPRPIDKALIAVANNGIGATQEVSTVINAINAPCTITGLRWSISIQQDGGTGICEGTWAIVVTYGGQTVSTMSHTDASTFYTPESNVLAFGAWSIDNNTQTKEFEGSTKTMRKLMLGDQVFLIAKGVATDTSRLFGVVQLFCKF